MADKIIQIPEIPVSVRIIRSSRKTMSIQITGDGQLIVRSPMKLSEKEIISFLLSKKNWIETHIQKTEHNRQNSKKTRRLQQKKYKKWQTRH